MLTQTTPEEPTLPTDEERLVAIVAYLNFELEKVTEYHTRVRDYWLAKANQPFAFDVKKFSEGRKKITGVLPSAHEISQTRKLLEYHNAQFRVYAAEPEDVLGTLEMLTLNYAPAAEHFRKAIELDPHNQKYRDNLAEAEARMLSDTKK